jgi:hypothetical protein
MYRHRFDNVGGQIPGGFVSLLKPSQAFVDDPSDANDAAQARALAGHIAALFVPAPVPEDWWAAGVNDNYRSALGNTYFMIQIRDTSGFTGGTISQYDIAYAPGAPSDGNIFTSLSYIKEWQKLLPLDIDYSDWPKIPKFGNNIDRKKVMVFFQAQTGSVLKPEFRTWHDPEVWLEVENGNVTYETQGTLNVLIRIWKSDGFVGGNVQDSRRTIIYGTRTLVIDALLNWSNALSANNNWATNQPKTVFPASLRKEYFAKLQTLTGSVLKPEFQTWT